MQTNSNGVSLTPLEVLEAMGYENPNNKIQILDLTVKQVKDLKDKQSKELALPKVPANKRPGLSVLEHEQKMTHVVLEKQTWDKGRKTSRFNE